MSLLSLITPEVGKPDSTEDAKIPTALAAVEAWANGEIDSTNMSTSASQLFLKLLAASNLHVNFGRVTTAPSAEEGANRYVVSGEVEHGLNAVPKCVLLNAANTTAISYGAEYADVPLFGVAGEPTGTKFGYKGVLNHPQSARDWSFYWLAIG